MTKNARWLKEGRDDTSIYLNYDDYKNDLEKRENEAKEFQPIYDYKSNLTFESPLYEIPLIEKDSILGQKRKVWHNNLSKDIYVEEALNVLAELKIKQPQLKLVKN